MRDADRLEVLHGGTQDAVIHVFVAPEADASNLNLGPLLDGESDADGIRRDGTDLGADGGKLTSMLREQFFQDNFGPLDLRGIILALRREGDLALFEAVEDVAGGNRVQAGVVNFADGRPLFDVDVDDPALGILFALKTDVLKVAGVPECVEVTFDGGGVVDVSGFAEDASLDGVGRNATVAVHLDGDDEVLLPNDGDSQEQKRHRNEESIPDGTIAPNYCSERGWRR